MRVRSIRGAAIAVAAMGITGLVASPSFANVRSRSSGSGLINITLSDVTAVAADDVWAVGGGADPADPDNSDPAVEHWDGTRWTQVNAAATPENEEGLESVSAAGPNDIWAVGSVGQRSFRDRQIEIEHWNGAAWSFVPPVQASFNNVLTAAVGPNDAWAVGALSTGGTGRNRTLVEHWDGSAWSVATVPDPDGSDGLSKVAAVSSDDVWAVGSRGPTSGLTRPLAMHWDGARWSIVPTPTIPDRTTVLSDVTAIASNDVWAVGMAFDSTVPSYSITFTEHWNGQRWRIVRSADTGAFNADGLATVAGVASNDVWAIGNFVSQDTEQTLAEHWDGQRWRIVPAPPSFLMCGAAAVASDDVWAVGSLIFQSRILHWDGTRWSMVPSP
jgi:hypothetical protein